MFDKIKGFRQSKKLTRKQKEREKSIKDFIGGYKKVCEEHKFQFDAVLEVTPEGILPKMTIIEHRPAPPFETKDWKKCQEENKETKRIEKEKQNLTNK